MKTFPLLTRGALAVTLAFALVGCENMSERQKGTATGGGIGAVVGAAIGSATGGKAATGALIGGAGPCKRSCPGKLTGVGGHERP